MRLTLNVDWFRDPSQRPGSRRLAYPANIEFDWKGWVEGGLADAAVLRPFALPFEGIFGGDPVAGDMVGSCRDRRIPVTVNRYVWNRVGLADEFKRVRSDGRFDGFVLYETWSYMRAHSDGSWRLSGPDDHGLPGEDDAITASRRRTAEAVRDVFRCHKAKA
jgi:hypothetical protein